MADEDIELNEQTPVEGEQTESQTPVETPAEGETPTGDSKSALDVISEAVEQASKPRTITPKADEQAQTDTRPRNADGTFKAETDEEKAAREKKDADEIARKNETPEQKAEREKKEAEAAAAKKPDPINDPIEKGTNERTAKRMQELIDIVKQQNVLVDQHGKLFDAIQGTGASPEEFAAMVNYMKAARSSDPAIMEQSYKMLQSELRALAVRMGKPLYEVNLLRDPANKDLVDEIQAGSLTSNRAHEIALQRETVRYRDAHNQRTQSATQTAAQKTADEQTGRSELDALDAELRKRDGDGVFEAKYDILVPALEDVMQRSNPREWKGIFLAAYNKIKVKPPAAAAPAPILKERSQPLRPKTPAGAGATQTGPKSALDAINQALES